MSEQGAELPVVLDQEDLVAVVAHFAAHPHCAACGGRAELRPGPGGRTDVVIWHEDSCTELAKALKCDPRPVDVQRETPATFRSFG